MYLEVYIDVIFIINFVMDIILLVTVKRIMKCQGSIVRLLLGAVIGATGACILVVLPNKNGLVQFLFSYIIICFAMIGIAYRQKAWKGKLKAVILLYITTFVLGGVLHSLYYYTSLGYYFTELIQGRLFENQKGNFYILSILLLLSVIPIYIKIMQNCRSGSLKIYQVEMTFKEKSTRIIGLLDTGNSLYDPIFGKPVIIAECSALETLLSENQVKLLNSILDTIEENSHQKKIPYDKMLCHEDEEEQLNIMMIPYHSIGKSGMLPAIMMSKIIIWDGDEQICNEKVLTAVSRNRISKESEYQVILHRELV